MKSERTVPPGLAPRPALREPTHTALAGPICPGVGVVAFVPDRWDGLWQVRHYMLSRLARFFHVVWFNPPHERQQVLQRSPLRRPAPVLTGVSPSFRIYTAEWYLPKLYRPAWIASRFAHERVRRAQRALTDAGCEKLVAYLWRPEFAEVLDATGWDCSVYHIDDEYAFRPDPPPNAREVDVIRRVDQVIVHSSRLLEKKGVNPHTALVPNGVDYARYATPQNEPLDLRDIPHPRVGYTGTLKATLDWALLFELAERHPDWQLVLVGPCKDAASGTHERLERLRTRPNVHWLGAKPAQARAA